MTTPNLTEPTDIVARAREIEADVTRLDERIADVKEELKALRDSREALLAELRAVVRPVPLFDATAGD